MLFKTSDKSRLSKNIYPSLNLITIFEVVHFHSTTVIIIITAKNSFHWNSALSLMNHNVQRVNSAISKCVTKGRAMFGVLST